LAQGLGLSAIIPLISLNEMFLLWDANNAGTEDEVIAGISDDDDDDDDDGDTDEASTVRYTTEEEYDK
jgi:hypothetical protein